MDPKLESYLRSKLPEGVRWEDIVPPRDPEVLRSGYKRVVKIADDFLSRRVGLLGASRALRIMSFHIDTQAEPEFKLFTEIAESSWDLPIGSDREFYPYKGTDEDLRIAIRRLEDQHEEAARAAAQTLIRKFGVLSEQVASPNGGPAAPLSNSVIIKGPPSVS